MSWDITQEFEYVVNKEDPPRICFGTPLERELLPTEGPAMSPFMRRYGARKKMPHLGPGTHHNENRSAFYDLTHRHISKLGLGSQTPRWVKPKQEYQPPPRPPKPEYRLPQNCAPFNQIAKKKPFFAINPYPAPCDYCPQLKKREIKFSHCFLTKKVMRCPVLTKCVPYNLDACAVCGCLCSAQGDYWQYENRISLCRKHYDILFNHCLAKFRGVKLSEFKSVRDCFYAHAHNSCMASVKIMKSEEIKKKLRKEAYLDLYFPQRRFCND